MPKRSVILRLEDMTEAVGRVRDVLGDLSVEAFEADWQKHWLVQRGIEIISEASRHLPPEMKARHPEYLGQKLPASATSCDTVMSRSLPQYYGSLPAKTYLCLIKRAAKSWQLRTTKKICRSTFRKKKAIS